MLVRRALKIEMIIGVIDAASLCLRGSTSMTHGRAGERDVQLEQVVDHAVVIRAGGDHEAVGAHVRHDQRLLPRGGRGGGGIAAGRRAG